MASCATLANCGLAGSLSRPAALARAMVGNNGLPRASL